jgi:stage II sporulation protein GA (sporulation sigma-E factor processing peptidase)
MAVYLDLIFLTNLLMDGALLQTTAWTRKVKVKFWRLLIASVIGASYVVFMFFPSMSVLYTFLMKALFSLTMVYIAFGFGSLQHFARNLGAFYLVNFAAAGSMFGIHYFLLSSNEVMNGILFTQSGGSGFVVQVSLVFVLITFFIGVWFYKLMHRVKEEREQLTQYIAEIEVYLGEHEIACSGLVDTGNQLYDPLTRIPVMVMETKCFEKVLPASWMQRIADDSLQDILDSIGEDDFAGQERLRLIPYRGIRKGSEFMVALKPDKVVIVHNAQRREVDKVYIGFKGNPLSSDGSYQAIVHPKLLEAKTH